MPIEITESDLSAPRTLARGDEVVIRLPENPTTGYRWQVTHSGAGELALLEERFVPGADNAGVGAGGDRLLRFRGRSAGEVRLEAVLRRAWDPPQASLRRHEFAIVVR